MKRLYSVAVVILLTVTSISTFAQSPEQCRFDHLHKKRMTEDPGFAEGVSSARKLIEKVMFEQQQQLIQPTTGPQYQIIGDVLQIPVVVHIIHTGTSVGVGANITDSQVDSAIIALNDRFRKTPGTHGDASGVDTEIQFVLASRDPDCNSTTGIVRVNGSSVSNYSTQGISAGGSSGADEIDVKNLSRWPNTDYMNIWVVSEIENNNGGFGIQGYAYFPGASAVVDGLVVQHTSFGVSGTVNSWNNLNRTVTHEVGHYLGLYHTFEGDSGGASCPPVTNGCGSGLGDCVTDTEPHIRSSSNCPTGSTNTCTSTTVGLVVRNYMDYSSQTCANMYTSGQKAVMRAAIFGPRRSLLSSNAYLAPDTLTLASADCTPQTSNLSNLFGIGIRNVTLDSLNVTSSGSVSDSGYVDRTCNQVLYVEPNTSYDLSITTGSANNEDVRVYIDYNSDGDFLDTNELVFTNDTDTHHVGTITTPSNVVFNEKLRMRVLSEWHGLTTNLNAAGSCYNPTYGQAEDFALVFADTTTTTPSPGCASTTNGTWDVNPTSLWSCGSVPDSTVDVTISAGDSVSITADATVSQLFIENGGILHLTSGVELVVKGDSLHIQGGTQGGKLSFESGSSLVMRGESGTVQRIVNDAGNAVRFENLVLHNNDDVEFATGDFELGGSLRIKSENLINNSASFTFLSDSVSTAHVAEFNSTSGIQGDDFTVQRFMSSRLGEWNSIGASGVSTTLEDLDGEIQTSGFTGTDSPLGSPSIQYWDNTSNAYVTPTNTSDTFRLGRGYHVWLENSSGQWNSDAWELVGPINTNQTSLSVNSSGAGWNLLANPYAAYLDFAAINAANSSIIGDEFWYYDADSVTFNSRGPIAFIPPGQAFWINWSGTAGTIDIDLSDIRDDLSTSELFKREPIEQLKVLLTNAEKTKGEAVYIRKQVGTTANRDAEDVPEILLPTQKSVGLTMITDEFNLMVNHVDPYTSHVLYLKADVATSGTYELEFSGLRHFSTEYCLSLESEGKTYDVSTNNSINLQFAPESLSKSLVLTLERKEDCESEVQFGSLGQIYTNRKEVTINLHAGLSQPAQIEIYNLLGSEILQTGGDSGVESYRLNLDHVPAGIYLVKISSGGLEQIQKVVLD